MTIDLFVNSRVNKSNRNKYATQAELDAHLGTPALSLTVDNFNYYDTTYGTFTISHIGGLPNYNYCKVDDRYFYITGVTYNGGVSWTIAVVLDAWHTLGGVSGIIDIFGVRLPIARHPSNIYRAANADLEIPTTTEVTFASDRGTPDPGDLLCSPVESGLLPNQTRIPYFMVWYIMTIPLGEYEIMKWHHIGHYLSNIGLQNEPDGIQSGYQVLGVPLPYDTTLLPGSHYYKDTDTNTWNIIGDIGQSLHLNSKLGDKIANIIVDPVMAHGEMISSAGRYHFMSDSRFKPQLAVPYNDSDWCWMNYKDDGANDVQKWFLNPRKLTYKGSNLTKPFNPYTSSIPHGDYYTATLMGQTMTYPNDLKYSDAGSLVVRHTITPNKILYDVQFSTTIRSQTTLHTMQAGWQVSLPWAVSAENIFWRDNKNAYEQSVSMPIAALDQQVKWQQLQTFTQGVQGIVAGGLMNPALGAAAGLNSAVSLLASNDNAKFQAGQIKENFNLMLGNLKNQNPTVNQGDGVHLIDTNYPYVKVRHSILTEAIDTAQAYYQKYGYAQFGNLEYIESDIGFWQWKNVSDYIDAGLVTDAMYSLIIGELEMGYRIISDAAMMLPGETDDNINIS